MFAQANSEHCRHKIFNASFVDRRRRETGPLSLFQMIRKHARAAAGAGHPVIAYSRQRRGHEGPRRVQRFFPGDPKTARSTNTRPEDRQRGPDEGGDPQPPDRDLAVSRRRRPARAGRLEMKELQAAAPSPRRGCAASRCLEPARCRRPERFRGRSCYGRQAGAYRRRRCEIMIDGPLGAAAYNNEFGRPNLAGYFRTYRTAKRTGSVYGATTSRSCWPAAWGNIRGGHLIAEGRDPRPASNAGPVLGGPGAAASGMGGSAASLQQGGRHQGGRS